MRESTGVKTFPLATPPKKVNLVLDSSKISTVASNSEMDINATIAASINKNLTDSTLEPATFS